MFEAAARQLSFTRAAKEFNVTQAAVSKRVRLLERDLGRQLFNRLGRSLELTPEGRRLFEAAENAFDFRDDACAALKGTAEPRVVTIAANTAVSHFWLGPILRAFSLENDAIPIQLLTSDRTPDLVNEHVDLAILYGRGARLGWHQVPLIGEALVPVAAPRCLVEHGVETVRCPSLEPSDIAALPLLDYEEREPDWVNLARWFKHVGVLQIPKAHLRRFSNYALVIEAAIAGVGVALGSRALLARYLANGELLEISDRAIHTGRGYYLAFSADKTLSQDANHLLRWLTANTAWNVT